MSRTFVLAAVVALAVLLSSCGDGGGKQVQTLQTPGGLTAQPLNSQIEVGDTRFAMALQDANGELLLNANITYRFFKVEGDQGTLKLETPARAITLRESFTTLEDDGTLTTHEGPEVGGYVATVNFDEAGNWGVELNGTQRDGTPVQGLRFSFNVLDQGTVPRIGAAAQRSQQTVLRDVQDISEIDSSNPPHPEMHEKTIAEALDTGKPVVIAFATPAFCVSRLCGPVIDGVISPLLDTYRDQVEFVHVEPYDLNQARSGAGLHPVPVMDEWGLQTEPWVFVVDKQGKIAAKFEGIMDEQEVDAAVQQVLG